MRIVGIGGTLRPGSSCEAALRIALDEASQRGARTQCFASEALRLPLYEPFNPIRTPEALALVNALREADGVILASPGYHGSVSGVIKNALDYTEDMAGDDRVYFDGLPVGCIGVANGWQAAVATMEALRTITHALRGWPTPLGCVGKARPGLFNDGACADGDFEANLRLLGRQVATFAALPKAFRGPVRPLEAVGA